MGQGATELERVAAEASTCTRCRLHQGRTQVVFGQGSPTADLMFVGEAPGFHEDRQGRPFVGPSGQLLNRLLTEIGLRREDVYICNVICCRPPGNRDPQPDEIAACADWMDAELRLVDPKVVVTLGNFAARTLLGTTTGITRLRGRTYDFGGRVLLPTFHPSAALRADTSGRTENRTLNAMREDFQVLAKLLAERRPVPDEAAPPVPAAEGGPPSTPDGPPAALPGPGTTPAPSPHPAAPPESGAAEPSPSAAAELGAPDPSPGAAAAAEVGGPALTEGEQLGLF
jgi:DNA polymerase